MKKSILMLLAGISLVACGKSSPEPSPTPNPSPTPTPPKREIVIQHHITKIERYDGALGDKTFELSFTYDQGKRLNTFVEKYYMGGNRVQEIAGRVRHEAGKIRAEVDDHKAQSDLGKATEYLLELDTTTGRAKQLVQTYHFAQPDVRPETEYTFDSEGKQTSFTSNFVNRATLEWQGANLVKVLHERNNIKYTEQRAYNDIKNDIYPDLNLFLQRIVLSPKNKYLWTAELGLRADKLLKSFQVRSTPADKDLDNDKSFTYELDAKGRPSRITEQGKDGAERTIYRITYLEP